MPGSRSLLHSACTLLLAALTAGCANISSPIESPGSAGQFHGPPAAPAPVTPLPPPPPPPGTPGTWRITVANLPGEDLAGPCNYDLYLANTASTLRGVLVLYDRGDTRQLFADADVRSLAGTLQLALLYPEQCDAASFSDIQQNAAAGPGRALFAALDQLATSAAHPELTNANAVLFGFSAAGVLAATTANYKPARIAGVIAYDGASAHQQLNDVAPTTTALEIPFLVLSNDQDVDAGTTRDEIFFSWGWQRSAPWAYAVQHGVGHCCTLSTKPLLLPWIEAVVAERLGTGTTLAPVAQSTGLFADYACTPNGLEDVTGYENCTFTSASVLPAGNTSANAQGWLPDSTTAAAWLKWVGK